MTWTVHLHERVSRHAGQSADSLGAVIDGQHEPATMNDAGLAQDHELFGREVRVFDHELTGIAAATKPVGEIVQGATKAMLPEGIGEVRKFARFAHDNTIQVHGRRVEHHFDGGFRKAPQNRVNVLSFLTGNGLYGRQLGLAALFEKGREQGRLSIEVIVQRSFRNAGFPRNLGHGRPFVSARQKHLFRTLQDLLALGAQLTQRSAAFVRRALGVGVRRAGHEGTGSFYGSSTVSIMLTELVGHRKIISVSGVSL